MMGLMGLAARSAWNRRFALSLVVLSIALSTLLLLGIERIRLQVREHFSQAVSGTDLIVGPRTGSVQLLLYAVFRIGSSGNPVRWGSVEAVRQMRAVDWVVPLSLGDSHRGFAVLGTTPEYFQRFRHGDQQALSLAAGRVFSAGASGVFEAVLGADVAEQLTLAPGRQIVLSHGDGAMEDNDHEDKPFTIVGVLARTGTPVDRSVHISLESMEAVHLDWVGGAHLPGTHVSADQARQQDLTPRTVTAMLVGLRNRAAVFSVQRQVNGYTGEPLMGILPSVALDELWDVVGAGERALVAVSALVGVVSLAGLVAVILAGLNERRRELAILRATGAGPGQMMTLLALEGGLVTAAGVALGALLCWGGLAGAQTWIQARWGLTVTASALSLDEWRLLGTVLGAGWLASLVPGLRAYQLSLADGLSPRI